MSTTIDSKVVEMKFDNRQFEQNVSTTMSTLEKLKQGLNLSGASKGLENVNAAARGINLSPIGSAAETVGLKFNAMYTMADQALRNITNSAYNAGKKIVSALTIDPVKTGFQEYETQIKSVQTILANTSHNGTTLDDVNGALDELNTYADKTIYNFTEMTRNIGTFTAAGLGLEDSVSAIKGIANLAAVSGSTSQQASTAMYQLSQALANGRVNLQDWNSVVNAGMGGKVFQDALIRTAAAMKGVTEETFRAKNVTGSFRESISGKDGTGWLTADVLSKTLQQFTGDMTDAELAAMGFSKAQIKSIQQMGVTANEAATKVKTATQLWDTLKETAQSGWTQTWELILGDFEGAKSLFSGIYETLSPILEASAKSRNELLGGALTSNWDKLVTKINDAGISTETFEKKLKSAMKDSGLDVKALVKEHGSLAEAFKSGAVSSDILKKAVSSLEGKMIDLSSVKKKLNIGDTGKDVKKVQKALKELNYDIGKTGADGIFGKNTEKAIKAFQKANKLKVTGVVDKKTIEALEKASVKAEGLTDSVSGLIEGIDKLGGRELLIESLKNMFEAVKSVVIPVKEAFREIFPPTTSEQLYSIIEAFHNFTERLTLSETATENLKRTLKGIFAVLDVVKQAFVAVFKAISPLFGGLDNLGGGILEATALIGDRLLSWRDSIEESNIFGEFVEKTHEGISKLKNAFQDFKESEFFADAIDKARIAINNLANTFDKVKGLFTPILNSIKEVGPALSNTFSDFSAKAKERLGVLTAIGNFIKSVFVGLGKLVHKIFPYVSDAAIGIGNVMKDVLETLATSIQNADYDKVFDVISGGIMSAIGIGIAKFMNGGGDVFSGASGIIDGIKDVLEGAGDALGAFQDSLKADVLKKIAIAIAVLAGALLVLALIPSDRLATALLSVTTLFGELMGSMAILSKVGDIKGIAKIATAIVTLSAALLILSVSLKIMSTMSWSEMGVGLISLTVGLGALIGAVNLLPEKKVSGAAKAIKKMSTAILILAVGIKIMSTMSWSEMAVGLTSMVVGLGAMVGAVNLLPKDTALRAAGLVGLATAMVILGAALKIMATMSWSDIARSLVTLAGSLGILAGAMALMKTALPGAAAMAIIAPTLLVLAGAMTILGNMSWSEVAKGLVMLGGSLLIIAGGMALMKTALPGAAALLVVAASLAVLTPVLMAFGSMSLAEIGKSILMLAGVFTVFGLAALVLQPLVPTMLALAGSLTLLGIACAAIGAGVLMCGAGLTLLATALAASGGAITVFVASIISLIPFLIEQIGIGIIKLCEVIAGGSAAICEAATVIIVALVDALVASVPAIVEGALVLIDELLGALVEYTPKVVVALFDFLIGVINAVAEKLPELIQAGVNLLMKFFSGVVDALKSVDPKILLNGLVAVGVLSAIVIAMAAIAALTPLAMIGVIGMGAVITELAFVLAAVGALAQIPGLDWLISEGGNFLQTVGTAIGKFVGGLVGGFGQGVSSSLPQIGKDLSAFMESASGFIEGAKSIDAGSMAGIKSLVGVILALTGADIIQGLTSWLTGGSSLTRFGEELAAFGPNMKAYADSVSGIDTSAVASSAAAAQALAEMTKHIPNEGGMVAWFTGENSISKFGTELVTLGMGLKSYSMAITGFNAEAVVASANAATALADMTSHIPNEGGVVAWFAGENSIARFGNELVVLGMSLAMYSRAIIGFDGEAVVASANAAMALADMTSKIPNEGGMVAWFTGENSVANFGMELVVLGNSLSAYSDAIVGFNAEAVIASANAAKALAGMTSTIPNEGGMVAWFAGENSIVNFGMELISLGNSLSAYSNAIVGFNAEAVVASANAAQSLAQMTSYIPNEGGVVAWFAGENSVAAFADQLPALGEGLKGFSDSIEGINAENITAAANAAQALAQMASYIPNEGGLAAWFKGDNSVAAFADQLPTLGEGLKGFSDSIDGIVPENVTAAANAAKALAQMAETAPADTSTLTLFGDNLVIFGEDLNSYFEKISGVTSETISASNNALKSVKNAASGINPSDFTSASKAIEDLVSAIKSMSKVKSDAADSFSAAMHKLAKTNIKSVIDAFKNAGSDMTKAGENAFQKFIDGAKSKGSDMKTSGQAGIDKFVEGMTSRESKVKTACKDIASACATAMKDKYDSFKSAGKYLVDGFADGITAKTWQAEAKARAMAKAAAKAAEKALDINSPSKVFRAIGYSVPEGFAQGIDKMGRMVTESSVSMATNAVGNVKDSISRMADIINTDIDSQPTIRPVLDLSNVRSGASAISGMFGDSASVDVLANVRSISSMMNGRGLSATNNDVVSAIDKLRKDLSNVGGTTYNVNGVTYDDGSNVSSAIESLVRYAKIERRV